MSLISSGGRFWPVEFRISQRRLFWTQIKRCSDLHLPDVLNSAYEVKTILWSRNWSPQSHSIYLTSTFVFRPSCKWLRICRLSRRRRTAIQNIECSVSGKLRKFVLHAYPKQSFCPENSTSRRLKREIRYLKGDFIAKGVSKSSFNPLLRHTHTSSTITSSFFDLCGGNIRGFFYYPSPWFRSLSSQEKAWKIINWMIDIAMAIADFHALRGVHHNLTPKNILQGT